MKHRAISVLCAAALCAGLAAPAMAADAPKDTPEDDGVLDWEEVGPRIRAGSLNVQALGENIQSIQAINYDSMLSSLRDDLNGLAEAEFLMYKLNNSAKAESLHTTYDTLRDTFDAIRDGDMQEDNAAVERQLTNAIDQIAIAGETLYINLVSMESQRDSALRGLETIDRSLSELRLRQRYGQVSAQTVADLELTRAKTESQLATLENAIATYTDQLQLLLGDEPTGELSLGGVPEVTAEELMAVDVEADLLAAKERSYALLDAKRTLDDAEEKWKDDKKDAIGSAYRLEMAKHTWNSAQITYAAAVESFEGSFRKVCRAVSDDWQAAKSKEAAAVRAQQLLDVARSKYDRGLISRYALLDAEEALDSANSEWAAAKLTLFADYRTYQNAVTYGILD